MRATPSTAPTTSKTRRRPFLVGPGTGSVPSLFSPLDVDVGHAPFWLPRGHPTRVGQRAFWPLTGWSHRHLLEHATYGDRPADQPRPALEMIASARTKAAQRRSLAMTRSNSAQSSWVPPAAVKTDRIVAEHVKAVVGAVVGPEETHRPRDGHPVPAVLEHERRPGVLPQQFELAGAPVEHGAHAGRSVHRVGDDAGAHDRRVHRPVGAGDAEDGEVVVGRGQPGDVCEVCHGPILPQRGRLRPAQRRRPSSTAMPVAARASSRSPYGAPSTS